MKNIAYAGALVALLDIDMDVVAAAARREIRRKESPARIESRRRCSSATITRKQHFDCPLPFHLEKMDANGDKILIDGNTATALGCVYAGATVAAWYPITPATSVMDAFKEFCEQYRKDPETGENNFCILQAEDELGAIGMVIGASWNGARAFTSTSGPGISLMNELLGLAYYAEIPAVVIDVQRVGPSTGMPTRTQQGDLLECAYASHGDTKHILLFPSNPGRVLRIRRQGVRSGRAFPDPGVHDVRSRHRHERLGGAAAELGRFVTGPTAARVLTPKISRRLPKFFTLLCRKMKIIVAARTLPGVHSKGAFFTRGSGHNKFGGYTEMPDEYQEVMDRLLRKHKAAARFVPAPIIQERREARASAIVTHRRLRSGGARSSRSARGPGIPDRLYARARFPVR